MGSTILYAALGHWLSSSVEGLVALAPLPGSDGLDARRGALADAVGSNHERRNAECCQLGMASASRYLMGDASKGGRAATPHELRGLRGCRRRAAGWRWWPRGVPFGLARCRVCDGWMGECRDPSPTFAGCLMRVHCRCENANRCAACGELLYEWRLNANYYDLADDEVMHVPGFCGLGHRCRAPRDGHERDGRQASGRGPRRPRGLVYGVIDDDPPYLVFLEGDEALYLQQLHDALWRWGDFRRRVGEEEFASVLEAPGHGDVRGLRSRAARGGGGRGAHRDRRRGGRGLRGAVGGRAAAARR